MELTDEMKRAAVYAYEHATEYPYNQSALYVAVAAALNTRSSLLGLVPEEWVILELNWDDECQNYEAILGPPTPTHGPYYEGTGPTPEQAVADAASKVKP